VGLEGQLGERAWERLGVSLLLVARG
jgi:hypothetical protein